MFERIARGIVLFGVVGACLVGCSKDSGSSNESPDEAETTTDESNGDQATDDQAEVDSEQTDWANAENADAAFEALSWQTMRTNMDYLAADERGGRVGGSPGHAEGVDYIAAQLESYGVTPFGDEGTFLHTYDSEGGGDLMVNEDGDIVANSYATGINVVGLIEGSDEALADEYVVFMAHHDHLGVDSDGAVFNGAFDDAGGVVVGLELARVLTSENAAPRRSVIFLFTDEEEQGLNGAAQWIANPPVPVADIIMGISADPLGRGVLPDYHAHVIAGLEKSPELREFWEGTADLTETDVSLINRSMIIGFASDQDRFHEAGVPALWYNNIGFSYYHTVNDAAETIATCSVACGWLETPTNAFPIRAPLICRWPTPREQRCCSRALAHRQY